MQGNFGSEERRQRRILGALVLIILVAGLLVGTAILFSASLWVIAGRLGIAQAVAPTETETIEKIAVAVTEEATETLLPDQTPGTGSPSTRTPRPASPTRTASAVVGTVASPNASPTGTRGTTPNPTGTRGTTPNPTASPAPAATSAYVGGNNAAAGTKLTVTGAIQRTTAIAQGTALELKTQGEFAVIPVRMQDANGTPDCVNIKLYTADGKVINPSLSATATYNTVNDLDSLLPPCVAAGATLNGALVFEIPSGVGLSRLRMEDSAGQGSDIDLSK